MSQQKNVPELRFPEFQGEWEVLRGEELFNSRRERGEDNLPIYSVTQGNGLVPRDSLDRKMESDAASEQNLKAYPNDIVYNMMRMWQGAIGLSDVECMVSPAYIVLNSTEQAIPHYFNYVFKRPRSLYDLWAYSYGLTDDRLRLYYKDFARISFVVPKPPEQQKIANSLSSIDAKLGKLRRKKELLEEYKRGLMQQIFSQKIRFKQDDGSDFPEWNYVPLSTTCTVNPEYKALPEEFLYIDLESVQKGVLMLNKTVRKSEAPSRAQRVMEYGDVLFQMVRPYQKNNLFFTKKGNYVASTGYAQLRPNILGSFLYQLINSQSFLAEVLSRCSGSSYPAINSSDLQSIVVYVPESNVEQQKIANFLSSFDQKINAVAKQVSQLEVFKKGLLQKLFV